MNQPVQLRARFYLLLLLAMILPLLAGGCARSQLPVLIGAEGEPVSFKRRELHVERDWIHHVSRTAYRQPGLFFRPAAGGQEFMVEQWGLPDYTRKLRSMQGEPVVEWIYLDPALVCQFIEGELIFQGPLTDYEQLLLLRGRPDSVELMRDERGETRDVLSYQGLLVSRLEVYYLVNGRVVYGNEGN